MKLEKPHYVGHRKRLRQRFQKEGRRALADYEFLELLLFLALPRGDLKPLAKRLLDRFGSLSALCSADARIVLEVLGAGPSVVHTLKLIQAAAAEIGQQRLKGAPILLGGYEKVLDYCRPLMAHCTTEQLRVFFLNKRNELIHEDIQETGTIDHTPLYPREIVKRAVDLGAAAMILVHNHPSGDHTPSRADIDLTLKLNQAANALGIDLHDHLIVSSSGYSSLRSMGLY